MALVCGLKGFVSGRVQGVGFRYFVRRQAEAEQLVGYVRNLPDGRVEFLLQGNSDALKRVIERIRRGPDFARVSELVFDEIDLSENLTEFVIRR
ncbi:MAG: acylphosphatase [Gammaproteobacteria bacterium]|nr:MAG: acylphosphatase [Gammaproteobacteria bacterium]